MESTSLYQHPNESTMATEFPQPKSPDKNINCDLLVQRKYLIQSMQGDITDKYEYEARIGEGGFGVVYRVKDKTDGKMYAVKAILKSRVNDLRVFGNEV